MLGCTDTQHSRAALGDFAAHYLLPSIDVGVVFEGSNGAVRAQVAQFTQFRPDMPCGFCDGMIDPIRLAVELMTDEEKQMRREAACMAQASGVDGAQYWRGEPPQLITVGYLTSTAGSLAAGYAIGWLTGKFQMPHSRFQFDIAAPGFGFVDVERKRADTCSCRRTIGFADQARADRSVSKPDHWSAAFVLNLEQHRAVAGANGSESVTRKHNVHRWWCGLMRVAIAFAISFARSDSPEATMLFVALSHDHAEADVAAQHSGAATSFASAVGGGQSLSSLQRRKRQRERSGKDESLCVVGGVDLETTEIILRCWRRFVFAELAAAFLQSSRPLVRFLRPPWRKLGFS